MTKASLRKKWWRYEFDATGNLVSRRLADPLHEDGGLVFYVKARDPRSADKLAYNALQRAKLRARRARLRAEGKCRCGRERDTKFLKCSWCIERDNVAKERAAARRRGEGVPPADWRATREERRAMEAKELRTSVLIEVECLADACRNFGEFKRRLADLIVKAQKGGRAA